MKNSFFYRLFVTLDTKERKALAYFIASPYFNRRSQLIPFLAYFESCLAANKSPNEQLAYSHSFPKEAFDRTKLRLTLSQLFKLTEYFLGIRETEKESDFPHLFLMKSYRKKGLDQHFERTLRALEKNQTTEAEQSAEQYEKLYQKEWEKYQFQSSGKRTEQFNLQAISDSMDASFIARKLRHACFSFSHQAVYKTDYQIGLLPEVVTLVESSPSLLNLPAVRLYFECYLALSKPGAEVLFESFKKSLFELGHQLPKVEQSYLYLLAINYGIRQINAGRPRYDEPVLDLYRTALKENLLLENGRLSHFAFNNIVAIGVRIGETDWIEKFIEKHQKNLERKHRNVAVSLGLARLEHGRKNYGEALIYLQKSDYKDFINNLIAKTLQLKIYFETAEWEVLEAHLRNMKNYIRRKRAFGYHRENYLNIIQITQAIIEMNPFDKKEKEKLKNRIKNTEPLTERKWLLERIKD